MQGELGCKVKSSLSGSVKRGSKSIFPPSEPSHRVERLTSGHIKGWAVGFTFGVTQFDGDIRASKFNPLTIAKSQLNTSMSYYWSKTSLSLGYSLYKMIGSSGDSHSLNFGLTQNLLQNDSGQLQLTLNGSCNNLKGDGSQYVLSMSYQLATPDFMGNLNWIK